MVAQRGDLPRHHGPATRRPTRRVGLRELKERMSEIVRHVEEDGASVEITRRGEVIARLVPVDERPPFDREAFERRWAEHEELGREISALWPKGVSAVEAIRDVRE